MNMPTLNHFASRPLIGEMYQVFAIDLPRQCIDSIVISRIYWQPLATPLRMSSMENTMRGIGNSPMQKPLASFNLNYLTYMPNIFIIASIVKKKKKMRIGTKTILNIYAK